MLLSKRVLAPNFKFDYVSSARHCGLVVRLPGCRPRDPVLDSRRCQIFSVTVGLERGPLILMRINEELLERKK
jgi:hypothetical protein